ncbi:MAG TPA: helix-hairpin-helix domain-containing protein [Balneolales bacterium]|nr:helix-hairpin-helix domain-containing protein [Balneolales bacterium]
MWRRKIFFWLDSLNITPAERKVILILSIILIAVSLLNVTFRQRQKYHQSDYRKMEKIYRAKLAKAEKLDSMKHVKYYTSHSLTGNKAIKTSFKRSISKSRETNASKEISDSRVRDTLISINKAGLKSLMSLSGIGPKTARKIINYRGKHGPFPSLRSIKNVKGIGEKKFENIKSCISL